MKYAEVAQRESIFTAGWKRLGRLRFTPMSKMREKEEEEKQGRESRGRFCWFLYNNIHNISCMHGLHVENHSHSLLYPPTTPACPSLNHHILYKNEITAPPFSKSQFHLVEFPTKSLCWMSVEGRKKEQEKIGWGTRILPPPKKKKKKKKKLPKIH